MALNGLSLEEMVAVTERWVEVGSEARRVFEEHELLRPLMPSVEEAQRAVIEAQPKPADPAIAKLTKEAEALDVLHDQLVRGIYGGMTSYALINDGGDAVIALRDRLFPDGLSHAQRTYRAEAGHAARIAAQLTDADREHLKEIVVGKPLNTFVDEWLAASSSLAERIGERAEHLRASNPRGAGEARRRWMAAVVAVRSNADLSSLTEAEHQVLFGPLAEAEAKADTRTAAASPATVVEAALEEQQPA